MNISTLIRADRLILSTLFQCTEETRYYISGVCVEALSTGGALLVATDGHRLSVMKDLQGRTAITRIIAVPKSLHTVWKNLQPWQRATAWFALLCPDDFSTGRCEGRMFIAGNTPDDTAALERRILDITSEGIAWAGGIDLIGGELVELRGALFQQNLAQMHRQVSFSKTTSMLFCASPSPMAMAT